MLGIVKSQHKVLARLKSDAASESEILASAVQKLEFFQSDLEEYKRSCARLAKLVTSLLMHFLSGGGGGANFYPDSAAR
jgi:hypothetical protein